MGFLLSWTHLTDESTKTQSSDKLPKVTGLVSTGSRNLNQGLTLGPALNSHETVLLVSSLLSPVFPPLCPSGPKITNHKKAGFWKGSEGSKIVTPPFPHISEVPARLLESLGLYFYLFFIFFSNINHLLWNSRS